MSPSNQALVRTFVEAIDAQDRQRSQAPEAEGDRVAVRHRFRRTRTRPLGPHAASDRVPAATRRATDRIAGRRIAEAGAERDDLPGLKQRGHHAAD